MYLADVWHSHHWIDVRDWASTIATAAAAWLAYLAIRHSHHQARASADALLAERHTTYTLEILRDLADAVEGRLAGRSGSILRVQTLLQLCPERMPMTRAAFRAHPTDYERGAYMALAVERLGTLDWVRFDVCVALDEIAETARRLLGQPSLGREWDLQRLLDEVAAEEAAWRRRESAQAHASVHDQGGS
jgi:hypothetical protein